jgi:ABC-type multidrug transport system fused ATPase/permease subunit
MVAVMYVASLLHKDGKIELGDISAFLLYMLAMLMNFGILAQVFGNVASIVGATDKIVEMINVEPLINTEGGTKIPSEETMGNIELRDVKFHYPNKSEIPVLKGISLKVENKKNRVVALCGTSGCGKSTIISMIERFYDPASGSILFNGHDIKTLNPRWYHQQIAIVQQEPVLFSGTIKENITYGLDNIEGMDE